MLMPLVKPAATVQPGSDLPDACCLDQCGNNQKCCKCSNGNNAIACIANSRECPTTCDGLDQIDFNAAMVAPSNTIPPVTPNVARTRAVNPIPNAAGVRGL